MNYEKILAEFKRMIVKKTSYSDDLNDLEYYSIRDNCGVACHDFIDYVKYNHNIALTRQRGYYITENPVYEYHDFTETEHQHMKSMKLNPYKEKDRLAYITQLNLNEKYCYVPHFWV